MGQQVLTLGLATDKAFLPLDMQLCVSKTRAMGLNRPYQDGRSVFARRYREATGQTKLEMLENMIKRALRVGVGLFDGSGHGTHRPTDKRFFCSESPTGRVHAPARVRVTVFLDDNPGGVEPRNLSNKKSQVIFGRLRRGDFRL